MAIANACNSEVCSVSGFDVVVEDQETSGSKLYVKFNLETEKLPQDEFFLYIKVESSCYIRSCSELKIYKSGSPSIGKFRT